MVCMRIEQRRSDSSLPKDDFDSSVVEADWAYHMQIGVGGDKGYVPLELAAFIAGACWARQVLAGKEEG